MCETSERQDLIDSLKDRYGWCVFYGQRYYKPSGTGLGKIEYPWWAPLTFFVSRWRNRIYILRHVLTPEDGWLHYEDNWGYGYWGKEQEPFWSWAKRRFAGRLWYTLKCCLCVLFCYDRRPTEEVHGKWFHDWINVAMYDVHPNHDEWSSTGWTSVEVGRGIFKNWFFRDFEDSSA